MRLLESLLHSIGRGSAVSSGRTSTCCFLPLVAALDGALVVESAEKAEWEGTNEKQREFLAKIFQPCRPAMAKIPEIQSISSGDAETINSWLAGHGFNIQLQPFAKSSFGVASILDLSTLFRSPGQRSKLKGRDRNDYDAVTLYQHVDFWSLESSHHQSIARIESNSEDVMYMTIAEKPLQGFELLRACMDITASLSDARIKQYSRVQFPMVTIREQPDLSWVLGLTSSSSSGMPMVIVQALQQERFRMNETGARTQASAAAEVLVRSARPPGFPPQPMIIDRPFLLWIVRPDVPIPVFAAYVSYDTWQDPGDIHT